MVERFEGGSVRGFVHSPPAWNGDAVVLAHGAGANCEAKLLVSMADAFSTAGFVALRIDLPFRQKRPSGPPIPAMASADRDGLRQAAEAMRAAGAKRIVLGGHSYGGRMASMLAADAPDVASALLLLSYPLHPPRNKEQLRTAHFAFIRTPVLFVHGTRDPFGLPEEMTEALKQIPGRLTYSEVTGAGHDLRSGKFDIEALAILPLQALLAAA